MHELNLPEKGAASPELMQKCVSLWDENARKNGIDLSGFDPTSSLAKRLAWALNLGLIIATIYTRFSTKRQGSTGDQMRSAIEFGARNKMYCPPELLCVDEAKKGSKDRRDGLDRLKQILTARYASCLLVFKLSRLYRKAYKSVQFISEELVDEGLRAVAVGQNIDTASEKTWRLQVSMHGAMDEELLVAIADHVREGRIGLFLKGWVTGAIPVGYVPVEVPGAPPTRRNLPRTMPAIEAKTAELILQHYGWIAGGMEIIEGCRRWRAAGGAVDKRSITGQMSYTAYMRMLSRVAYIGVWEFCRKRNFWMSKKDAIEQRTQPPEEVKVFRCEDLRIVPDDLFFKVQERLNGQKTGKRARRDKEHHLWDLVIGLFRCPACDGRRFHMCGAQGQYMRCPNPDCRQRAMVDRRKAVGVLCAWASTAMQKDDALIDLIMQGFNGLDVVDQSAIDLEIEAEERKVQGKVRRMAALEGLLGEGSAEDDRRRKAEILAVQRERAESELQLSRLRQSRGGGREKPVTRQEVMQVLAGLLQLLDEAASGRLGAEVVMKAVGVLEKLVGGAVLVHAERRPGRQRWSIRGSFTPKLVGVVRGELGAAMVVEPTGVVEQEVWFRKLPRVDEIADDVQRLYDVERLSFTEINVKLEATHGEPIGSGNCCAAYRRWYETRKLPLPERESKIGRPRKSA